MIIWALLPQKDFLPENLKIIDFNSLSRNLVKFKCLVKAMFPVKLKGDSCYQTLPPVSINQQGETVFRPQLTFIEAKSRIIQPLGVEEECSIHFPSHFRLDNGKFIIYNQQETSNVLASILTTFPSKVLQLQDTDEKSTIRNSRVGFTTKFIC